MRGTRTLRALRDWGNPIGEICERGSGYAIVRDGVILVGQDWSPVIPLAVTLPNFVTSRPWCRIDLGRAGDTCRLMLARFTGLLLLGAGCCCGQAETAVTARLKEEFKETYRYTPPAAEEAVTDLSGEPVLELEPMIVTRSMETDILAEARRVAEARKAKEFSPLRGGTLYSFRRGDIGFWPKIVPVNDTPVKKGDVAISVDLLRLKW